MFSKGFFLRVIKSPDYVPNIYYELFNPLPNNQLFKQFWKRRFQKILWNKEKMMVNKIFSFFNTAF